jgi:outer membrane immunogenic protein
MRISAALLTLGLMSSSALAADILEPVVPVEPVVIEEPVFSWTGFYTGLNAGWYWLNLDDEINNRRHGDKRRECFRDEFGDRICEDIVFDGRRGRFDNNIDDNGGFIGAQIGANYQTGAFVFGIEGDLQYSGFGDDDDDRRRRRARGEFDNVVFGFDGNGRFDVDWFGTARLRAGVAVGPEGRALIYGTGGFAFTGVERELNGEFFVDACDPLVDRCVRGRRRVNEDDSDTKVGFSLGAGIEYAFTDNVTAGIEYQYLSFDLGDDFNNVRPRRVDVDVDGRHHRFDFDDTVDAHTVRLKVNFLGGLGLFGGGS